MTAESIDAEIIRKAVGQFLQICDMYEFKNEKTLMKGI